MSVLDSSYEYAHIPTLSAINKQLLVPGAALESRFRCLGFSKGLQRRCHESAQGFPAHRKVMMRGTSEALQKNQVSAEDFVTIVRSMFCGYHDHWPRRDYCGGHLRQLWRNADPVTKENFKEAITNGHKDIFIYYARLQGCHVDDVENAIKTEEPVPDVSIDSQIVVYKPAQHPLLAEICELVGLQAMYSETQADGRESSNEPDATTSGASGSAVPTPYRVDINAWEHRFDQPIDFSVQPGLYTAGRSQEPGLVKSGASKALTDKIFQFPDVQNSASTKASRRSVSPLSRKLGDSDSGSDRTTPKVFTPKLPETSQGGLPSHSTSSLISLGNTRSEDDSGKTGVGRNTRGHTPESMTPGFRSGQSSSAPAPVEDTPTPLAKKAGLFGTGTTQFPKPHHRGSPSPVQPFLTPKNPNQFSAHVESPIEAATPPTQRGSFSPDYTPRSGTPRLRRTENIAYDIRDLLRKPINYDNKGYIYVLKAPHFFDQFPPSRDRAEPEQWVKIGITQNIEERMKSLIIQCRMTDLDVCGDDGVQGRMPMPILRRVEQLCHYELANYQRPLDCRQTGSKCDTTHREWFNITEEVAIRTVKRWLRFFDQSPYTDNGALKSGFWDDRVWNGEYLKAHNDEDVDRTHERYQSWLETCIQQHETKIAEEQMDKLRV